jgi:hypothetical protein
MSSPFGDTDLHLGVGAAPPPRIRTAIAAPHDSARGRASHGVVLWERRPRRELRAVVIIVSWRLAEIWKPVDFPAVTTGQ